MDRETVEFLKAPEERETVEARLQAMERAYEDLLQRVRRYERERVEIRARLERILARLGTSGPRPA